MELTRSLMNEFESFRPEGVYAQSYFKAIGLRKHPDAPMSLRRAEAVVWAADGSLGPARTARPACRPDCPKRP